MELRFTLKDMDSVYAEATGYTTDFKAAMDNLDNSVNALGGYWTSDETGTYQTFQELYNTKKQTLIEAYEYMKKFCAKIDEMRSEFDSASTNSKNRFE